ncbi:hypothetical protein [Priestia megaterium]
MKDILITIVLPLIIGIVPAIISYFAAKYQSMISLQIAKDQQNTALQTLKEQQNAEMQKIKEQQNAEIQKIREQALLEIERMKAEVDKQAELYEKNVHTDLTKDVFSKMFLSDESAAATDNLFAGFEQLDMLNKMLESDAFKSLTNNQKKK